MSMPSRLRGAQLAGTAGLALMLFSAMSSANAQQRAKKEYTFRGRVKQVDAAAKRLTVDSEPIEGWMGAMTMAFKVSNEDVLTRLKPGDRITARVYDGDLTLYNVALAPQAGVTPVPAHP